MKEGGKKGEKGWVVGDKGEKRKDWKMTNRSWTRVSVSTGEAKRKGREMERERQKETKRERLRERGREKDNKNRRESE